MPRWGLEGGNQVKGGGPSGTKQGRSENIQEGR